jgi:DNA-binding MarR family transcriptional regulator
VTLNIGHALNRPLAKAGESLRQKRREVLEQAVVDELTSWNPVEFMGAFKRMHKGALSLVHINVLVELEACGPMSMGRLAEALEVSVASATGIVERMEHRGLVERRHDEQDRRVVLVHPAAGAANVFAAIQQRRREGLGTLIQALSDRQLIGLLSGHRALRRARTRIIAADAPPEAPGVGGTSS